MPLFDGHELTAPRAFLMENPEFDLILCGDYHYPFEATVDGRRLVNTGCMVRRSIFPRDMEHKPKVGIYDTDTKEIEYHFLDILPPEEAFDMNKIYTMKYEYEGGRFHTFGKALVGTRTGANFLDNLRTAMDNNTISDAASAEIETAIIPGKE